MRQPLDLILRLHDEASAKLKSIGGAIQNVGASARSVGGGVNSMMSQAFAFATGGLITRGIDAITGSFGGLLKGMIGGNAEFEQYNTRFKVLLGSAEAAKQRMEELAKFGQTTPFELNEVIKADTILQGFGLHAEEAAKRFGFSGTQIRTIAGDVASGTGASFEEMSLLLGKFSAGATGEAISRMQELGITSRDELKKLGLEFTKAGELTTELPQSMNVVLELMQKKYGGLMDAQSTTFSGMISNLQDWFSGTLRIIGQPLFEVLKEKLQGVLVILGSPEVKAGIESFAKALSSGLGTAIDFISTGIAVATPIIQSLIGLFKSTSSSGSESLGSLGLAWQTVQALITRVVTTIQGLIQTGMQIIQTFLVQHGAEIEQTFNAIWTQVTKIITLALALLDETIVPWFEAIAAFIKEHQAEILMVISAAWDVIKSVIMVALDIIEGVLKVALAVFRGDWEGAWQAVKDTLKNVWDDIKGIVMGAIEILITGMGQLGAMILKPLANAGTLLVGVGTDLIKGLVKGIADAAASVPRAIVGVLGDAVQAGRDVLGIKSPSKVTEQEIGLPMMQGPIRAIQAQAPLLTAALNDSLSAAVRGASMNIQPLVDRAFTPAVPGFDTSGITPRPTPTMIQPSDGFDLNQAAPTTTINVNVDAIQDLLDIESLANRVAELSSQRGRR